MYTWEPTSNFRTRVLPILLKLSVSFTPCFLPGVTLSSILGLFFRFLKFYVYKLLSFTRIVGCYVICSSPPPQLYFQIGFRLLNMFACTCSSLILLLYTDNISLCDSLSLLFIRFVITNPSINILMHGFLYQNARI